MTDDEKTARYYRELGAEEPPRALDEAILAAARHPHAGERRAARPWTQRWAVPLSLAAVLVLSVTVTVRMQREQPGIESPVPQAREKARVPEQAPAAAAPVAQARKQPKPFPAAAQDQAAAPPPSEMAASRRDVARNADAGAAGSVARNEARPAMAQMQAQRAKAAADTPQGELERIAELRKQDRNDEADKALIEFRRRFPDYIIPEAMRARVERR